MQELLPAVFEKINSDFWKECCRHVVEVEDKFIAIDGVRDEVIVIERIVINLDEDTDSDNLGSICESDEPESNDSSISSESHSDKSDSHSDINLSAIPKDSKSLDFSGNQPIEQLEEDIMMYSSFNWL